MKLLLISNSTNPGEGYLEYPMPYIQDFLGEKAMNALFIPYAAVTFSFDEYEEKVNAASTRLVTTLPVSTVSLTRWKPSNTPMPSSLAVATPGNSWICSGKRD